VTDLAAIKAKLTRAPAFWTQEVQPGTPPMATYEGLGSVLEFTYASNLRGQFRTGISGLDGFGGGGLYEPSDKAVVFVSNHDTERDGSTLSYHDVHAGLELRHPDRAQLLHVHQLRPVATG
jgi:alpha-amylase